MRRRSSGSSRAGIEQPQERAVRVDGRRPPRARGSPRLRRGRRPLTRPSRVVMDATSAPVRSSAPAARAASASAPVSAPRPPRTCTAEPAPLPPPAAACRSRLAVVPGGPGAGEGPEDARARRPPRAGSRPRTTPRRSRPPAMGRQRSRRWASSRPRPRRPRPSPASASGSARERPLQVGRCEREGARQQARHGAQAAVELGITLRVARGEAVHVRRRALRVAPQADAAPVRQRREDPRLGLEEAQPGRPGPARASTVARSGPARWATVEARKPGWNSSVTAAPPSTSRRSSTSTTLQPAPWPAARRSPGRCGPPPMTTTSRRSPDLPPLPVLQDLQGGQAAGRAHDPAAGMGGRAAHVEVPHRRAVARPARHRAQEEELLQATARPGRCCLR